MADRASFKQKYIRGLEQLRSQILTGAIPPGEYLPSENELTRAFGLSRPSIRKMLAELAKEGLIQTLPGKGSVVNELDSQRMELKLLWYTESSEIDLMQSLIDMYNREHRNVKVKLMPMVSSVYHEAYRGLLEVEKRPDMIGFSHNYLLHIMEAGIDRILLPLDDMADTLRREHYAALVDGFTYGGHLVAAPITFSPVILVYNKTMFDQKGLPYPDSTWTWEQLTEAALKLTERLDGYNQTYGFCFAVTRNRWPIFVLQNGGKLIDGQGRFAADDTAAIQAFEFCLDLMYKHRVTPLYSSGSPYIGEELFAHGKVGMLMTTHYFMEKFKESRFEWDIVSFPRGRKRAAFALTTGIGISRECPAPDAAKHFIRYVLSEPAQAYVKRHSPSLPTLKRVAESKRYPHFEFPGQGYYSFVDAMDCTYTLKDLGMTNEQFQKFESALQLAWSNIQPVREVWRNLAADMQPEAAR